MCRHLQLLVTEFIINPPLKIVPQIQCFCCLFVSSCRNMKLHIRCVTSSFKMSSAAEMSRHESVCILRLRRVTMRLQQKNNDSLCLCPAGWNPTGGRFSPVMQKVIDH